MRCDKIRPGLPIVSAYDRLRTLHPNWYVEWGRRDGNGWIPGEALIDPSTGGLGDLLQRIGMRMRTEDRKIIAASFVLRFGWSAGVAIAPYLLERCVPDIGLSNVSMKFSEGTLFEKVSLHEPSGVIIARQAETEHHLLDFCNGCDGCSPKFTADGSTEDLRELNHALPEVLRAALVNQARPVVEALHDWSRFSKRALWGQITSSWGSQFISILAHLNRRIESLEHVCAFFGAPDFVVGARPTYYLVTHLNQTHVYHRRATCCLYFKLPIGNYCASCPLVSQEERVRRNKDWMEKGH
jgi:FhuF 2Fe-2S C-terminal domain